MANGFSYAFRIEKGKRADLKHTKYYPTPWTPHFPCSPAILTFWVYQFDIPGGDGGGTAPS